MLIPVDYAQANFRFTGAVLPFGAEITMGFNVELFAGTPDAMAAQLAVDWQGAGMDNTHSNESALTSILVKFGPNATGPSGEWSGSIGGDVAPPTAAPNLAILVTKNTNFGGRTGRGRFYIPAQPESQINGAGAVDTGYQATIQSAVDAFLGLTITDGMVPVLLHGEDSPISAPMPITSFSVSSRAATQRRRMRR